MTKAELIATMVQTLAETYRVPVSAPAARGYLMALEDLTEDQIRAAGKRALKESKFMPAPSELLALAGAGRNLAAETAEAWGAVRRAIDVHDYTDSVDFGPLVNATVRNMGGWLRLCDLGREQLDVWARKEFERLYAAFVEKDPATLHGDALQGAFGGRPVLVPIGGKMPARALPARESVVSDVVRELAEAKS